jgi:hypothetical protein
VTMEEQIKRLLRVLGHTIDTTANLPRNQDRDGLHEETKESQKNAMKKNIDCETSNEEEMVPLLF